MRRRALVATRLVALGLSLLGTERWIAGSQGQVAWAQPAPRAPAVHKEGEYTGVVPGQAAGEGAPRRALRKGTLSWVGFMAKDGGAEVFFQAPGAFEVEQRLEGSTLVVRLAGLTRQLPNTRRPMDTRFFDNPLARVAARAARRSGKRPAGIEVRISFKDPKWARQGALRTKTEADGLFYAYLSFPEGAEGAEPPAADAAKADAEPNDSGAPAQQAGDSEAPR